MSDRIQNQKFSALLDAEDKAFLQNLADNLNVKNPPQPNTLSTDALIRQRLGFAMTSLVPLENYAYFKFDAPTAYAINNIFNSSASHKFALAPYLFSLLNPIDQTLWDEYDSRVLRGQSTDASLISRDLLKTVAVVAVVAVGAYAALAATAASTGSALAATQGGSLAGSTGLLGSTLTATPVLEASVLAAPTLTATQVVSGGGLLASIIDGAKSTGSDLLQTAGQTAIDSAKKDLLSQVIPAKSPATSVPVAPASQISTVQNNNNNFAKYLTPALLALLSLI